jgi:glycine/D-amino acid oxidase-like deaminating enzyme
MMVMKQFEIVIIGGGIAGLATAEIFARCGFKTLLVEKNAKLCTESSGLHHEWFHFGSLYSIFPRNHFLRFMVKGIEDLLFYYSDFDGMNLSVRDTDGQLLTIDNDGGWIRKDNLQYLITDTKHTDFHLQFNRGIYQKIFMKISWYYAVKQFIARHNRFYQCDWRKGNASSYIPRFGWWDYSEDRLADFQSDEINLNFAHHTIMQSYDSIMNAYQIISELTKSFLSNGGDILTDTCFENYQTLSNAILINLNNQSVKTRKLILATGKHLHQFIRQPLKVKTVLSPLLVAYPAVCSMNFVRLTPFVSSTINHLKHTIDGIDYSLIGSGIFIPENNEQSIINTQQNLLKNAKSVFPALNQAQLTTIYFGYKTELTDSVINRNYSYQIKEIEPDMFVILPGKFSLAFSLAINTFKQVVGHFPNPHLHYDKNLNVGNLIGLTKHKAIVKAFYETNHN